ncbi:MAG: methyltransferase domain-containing protein [Acidimicrobiales bacterium]
MTSPENDFGFDPDAPNDTAASLYRMARAGRAPVLHLGSGADAVPRALAALDDVKVTRVVADLSTLDAEATSGPEVFVADLEVAGWYAALDGRTYEVLIVADLLEHLRDPARILRDLREQRLLADDGRLLISFSNVAHQAVASELLSGDSTRIRWYTAGSMNRLLAASGYLLTETHRTHRPTGGQTTTSADDDAQTYEFVLQAQPSAAGPQLALVHRQLDDATQRLAEAETSRDQISALLDEERVAFQDEIGRGADELEQLQNQLNRATDKHAALRHETARLHRQLARLQDELSVAKTAMRRLTIIQQSRSYRWSRGLARAAHVVVAPIRSVRRRARGGR